MPETRTEKTPITTSREVRLASRPRGEPTEKNFYFADVQLPELKAGEVLVRNLYFSVDPYMRGRMNDVKSYVPAFEIGKVLDGAAVGRVIASADEKLASGALVFSILGWRESFIAPAASLRVLDESLAPVSAYLGLAGVTGLTAWVGLFRIANLKAGETVFVSGGAGAVGSAACQFAKSHGARVIASAGSEQKIRMLREQLGVDYAFNYQDGDPLDHLQKGAPDGIDVYFDNTAGPQLEAALSALKNHGRVALCGGIAGYNRPVPGPGNLHLAIVKRLRLQGFIITDHLAEMGEFLGSIGGAIKEGGLISHQTVVDGLEAAPAAFISLLRPGDSHTGKLVIRLA